MVRSDGEDVSTNLPSAISKVICPVTDKNSFASTALRV